MNPQAIFYQQGDIIDYTNSGTTIINSGDVVPMINRCGVAVTSIAVGATGGVCVEGVYICSAEPTVQFDYGDKLYYDVTNKVLTNVATGNVPAGWAVKAKATGGTKAYWGLNW